jgi:hypothetical protein
VHDRRTYCGRREPRVRNDAEQVTPRRIKPSARPPFLLCS